MIKIVAKIAVKEDCIDLFKAMAQELVEKSRAEEGNIYYSLNQNTEDKTKFAFIEIWKDQDAINIHNKTPHFTGILPQMMALTTERYPVEFYNEVIW